MKVAFLILITLFAGASWAKGFDIQTARQQAEKQASVIVANAEKRCHINKLLITVCLKNLQMQAIEKKIGVLEELYNLSSHAPKSPLKQKVLSDLQSQIQQETQFLGFYKNRSFDGNEALAMDLKYLLVKQAQLKHLKRRS